MADQSRKKQKHRLKREKKRRTLRKQRSASPARIFSAGGLEAVYVNADWRERGQATVFVLRRGRDGRLAMATFMIDLWCAGLKDAWGRIGLSRDEFEDMVDSMDAQMDNTIEEVSISEVADLVAGSIRFARQNGFRLPPHYDRWAALLGEINPGNADLSAFGFKEGDKNLCWVGPISDLRTRLIGSTLEDFLQRPDVHFVLGISDDEMDLDDDDDEFDNEFDDDDDEEFEATCEVLDAMVEKGLAALRRWCFASGRVPEPRIDAALSLVLARGFGSLVETETCDADTLQQAEVIRKQERDYLQSLSESERLQVITAIRQVEEFFKELKSPQDTFATFGLPVSDDIKDE